MKIAFVGVPCSGKSTMAKETAKAIGGTFIPETARVLIEAMGRLPTKEDQNFIMRMQSCLEDSMVGKYKISDVPIFLNFIYYRLYSGDDDNSKKLYEMAKRHSYDLIFKLSPLPYSNDGIRYQTKKEIEEINNMIDEYQKDFGKFIYVETTDLNERIEFVKEEVKRYEIQS